MARKMAKVKKAPKVDPKILAVVDAGEDYRQKSAFLWVMLQLFDLVDKIEYTYGVLKV